MNISSNQVERDEITKMRLNTSHYNYLIYRKCASTLSEKNGKKWSKCFTLWSLIVKYFSISLYCVLVHCRWHDMAASLTILRLIFHPSKACWKNSMGSQRAKKKIFYTNEEKLERLWSIVNWTSIQFSF